MLVMPVGNMVLLARDFLLGATTPWGSIAMVLLSTTLYAMAAVAVAANIFGKESVVFADAASLRSVFNRSLIPPSAAPSISMSLLVVALLFPTWFFVQSVLSPRAGDSAAGSLYGTGWSMPLLFVVAPALVLMYWKIDLRRALALRIPPARFWVAATLIGLSAWVPAREIDVLQFRLIGAPDAMVQGLKVMQDSIAALGMTTALVLIAVIPALCEELLFRGFMLSGVASSLQKWTAIGLTAVVFGVFHFMLIRFAVTAGLGVVLAYICWQSRSVLPAMLAHFLHNGVGVLQIMDSPLTRYLGIPVSGGDADTVTWDHLPLPMVIIGLAVFAAGVALALGERRRA
jgi:membrane protease YdiL (CAAX protease family)